MNDPEASTEQPSLRQVTRMAGALAQACAGLILFVPTGVLLAFSGQARGLDGLVWLLVLALWSSAFLPRMRRWRPLIQTLSGFVLVTAALLAQSGPEWLPASVTCFAIIVGAVFTLSTRAAMIVVVLAAGLDLLAGISDSPGVVLLGINAIGPWTGPLLQLLAGGGLLLAWSAWIRRIELADDEFLEIRQALADERRMRAADAGFAAVARRIHETVLNTLTGISMGLGEEAQPEASRACRRDLEQLQRGLDRLPACALSAVVDSARAVLEPSSLSCRVRIEDDVAVDTALANALRDAIAESLRNVERHSGVLTAEISITVTNIVTVTIADVGRGPGDSGSERFGLRNAIRQNMAAIGGEAALTANDPTGTVVTLTAPLRGHHELVVPTFPILRAADSALWARLGAAGTNVFALIVAWAVAGTFASPIPVEWVVTAYVTTVLALALLWPTRLRMPLAWLGLLLLPVPFIDAAWAPLACQASPAVQGIVTGMAGGGTMLLLFTYRQITARVLIVLIASTGSVLLALRLPDSCQGAALLSVVVTTVYMAAIATALIWIDVIFESRRRDAQREWEAVLQDRIDRDREVAEDSGWATVRAPTRELLGGVSIGRYLVADPDVQRRAARQAALLREDLGLVTAAAGTIAEGLRAVADAAGVRFDVESLMPLHRRDPLPRSLEEDLHEAVRRSRATPTTLRTLVDEGWEEVVLVVSEGAVDGLALQSSQDAIVECERDEAGQAYISIRRPVSRTN